MNNKIHFKMQNFCLKKISIINLQSYPDLETEALAVLTERDSITLSSRRSLYRDISIKKIENGRNI